MNDTIKSANFDSVVSHDAGTGLPVYDRPLRGEDVRDMYKMIISNGIYPNPATSFQVLEGTQADEVVVKAGYGWVQGCPVWDMADEIVVLDPADSANPRIDLIVLQWNNLLANRWVKKVVITGTAAPNPQAPTLTRNTDIYEICLAEIRRPANSSLVTQANITDTRGDNDVCGWAHGVVDQVDTSTIWNQYAAWLQDIQDQWDTWWASQQDQSGYMTTNSEYVNLDTEDKTVIGAINEINEDLNNNYLPLSAGATKPLTDRLYLENEYGRARIGIGSAGGVSILAVEPGDDTATTVGMHSFISGGVGYTQLTANGGAIRFYPNGTGDTNTRTYIESNGNLTANGLISSNHPTSNPHFYLKSAGDIKADIYYSTSNGIFSLNNPSGGGINIYDSGYIYINGASKNIYIRPNGSATDEIYFNTSGQQVGGNKSWAADNSSGTGKSVSNSTNWTNLATITGLDGTGYYALWGKASFAPSAATAGILSLTISTTNNGSQQSWNSSCWTASSGVKYIEVFGLGALSATSMYLNAQSNGVASSVSTWYFRAIRFK